MIFPYDTLRSSIGLDIVGIMLDEQPLDIEAIRPTERFAYLYVHPNQDWDRVRLDVIATAKPDAVDRFETQYGPITLTAVTSCRPTNIRQGQVLAPSKSGPGRWTGRIELDRNDFRQRAVLKAVATATVTGIDHRIVGHSDQWWFYFDEASALRINGSLKVSWCRFDADDAPAIARAFPDSPYVVDLDLPLPVIYLNAAFEGLEPLLRDRRDRSPVEQSLHETYRMAIGRSVWMALLQDSISAVRPGDDDEEPDWPEKEWHREVLRQLLPEIEPDRSDSELLRLVADTWSMSPGSATFVARAEAAIGEHIDAHKVLSKSLRQLNKQGVFADATADGA